MIFSLFKRNSLSKWQHKNSNVRIEAINDDLDNNVAADQEILAKIVNSDVDQLVRRAALIKLNSFDAYHHASLRNDNSVIKEFAKKQMVKILLAEHNIVATSADKQQFLDSKPQKSLLEQWLFVEDDLAITKAIYEQLAKPHLLPRLFQQSRNEELQSYLLNQVDDLALLEKLQKKTLSLATSQLLNDKIDTLKQLAEKPKKINQSLQLLLSKLLALKDQSDYEIVVNKRQQLAQQWQDQQSDLLLLSEAQQQLFITKFQSINEQLDKIFVAKAEQYQQAQIRKQLLEQQAQEKQLLSDEIEALNKQIVNAVFEDAAIDHSVFADKLLQLQQQIMTSSLNDADKNTFSAQLALQKKRITQLPEIAVSISEATQLIAKIMQLAIPESIKVLNERQTIYQQWLVQWQHVVKQSDGLLPQSIIEAYQEIKQRWQQGLTPLVTEQKKLFNQVRKKHSDLKRLLNSGKYNACFSLFKKTAQQFELLSPTQQQKLQRDQLAIQEKMAELSDWEHYIATPRKQELIATIKAIAENPNEDANKQADLVKQYRKQWNLLGHADDEVDQNLNDHFNSLCEEAFAPCRRFYAQQENLRAQNQENRLVLINEAKALTAEFLNQETTDINWKDFDHRLNKLNQRWKNSGEVERRHYKQLMSDFNDAIAPLKNAIYQQQKTNASSKQQLITQAEAILDSLTAKSLDCKQAIAQTKLLQEKWRSLGYAGIRQENKLWQNFRKVNDQIFALREQDNQLQSSILLAQEEQFASKIAECEQRFEEAIQSNEQNSSLLNTTLENTNNLLVELNSQAVVSKKCVLNCGKLISKIEKAIEKQQSEQILQQWQLLFNLLKMLAIDESLFESLENNELFQLITMRWQKRIIELSTLKQIVERDDKTLELEILAGSNSPQELNEQRMKVQLLLMQTQMTSGTKIDLEKAFEQWLLLGKLQPSDVTLIERIEPIFVEQKSLAVS